MSVNDSSAEQRKAAALEPPSLTSSPEGLGIRDHTQHRRFATAPAGITPPFPHMQQHSPAASPHARAATDNTPHIFSPQLQDPPNHQPGKFLRKPMPGAQVVIESTESPNQAPDKKQKQEKTTLPSTVPSGVENMTGVGTFGHVEREPDLIYETGNSSPTTDISRVHRKTSRSPSPPKHGSPRMVLIPQAQSPKGQFEDGKVPSSPLLDAGVFDVGSECLDSGLSTAEEDVKSCEIPITWTGAGNDETRDVVKDLTPKQESAKPLISERISIGPMLPGGWNPVEDQHYTEGVSTERDETDATTPVHEVDAHIASPEVMHPDDKERKSQTGLVGFIPSQDSLPLPTHDKNKNNAPLGGTEGDSGQGWVMVSVEGKVPTQSKSSDSAQSLKTAANIASSPQTNDRPLTPPKQSSMSPAAKAIVIIDAIEANKTKAKSKDSRLSKPTSPSGFRRFFSITKAKKTSLTSPTTTDSAPESPKTREEKPKADVGFGSKVKRLNSVMEGSKATDDKPRGAS
jgi:hypothetical protein